MLLVAIVVVAGRALPQGRGSARLTALAAAAGTLGGAALAVARELSGMAGREIISIAVLAALLTALAALAVATWLAARKQPPSGAVARRLAALAARGGATGATRATGAPGATGEAGRAGQAGAKPTDWTARLWRGAAALVVGLSLFRAVPPVFLQ
jgi:hypothetical protein